MKVVNHTQFKRVHKVTTPSNILFMDFDETYFPHEFSSSRRGKMLELEEYLSDKARHQQLMFGWVTGSSLESVFSKMEKGGLTLLPNFIASNLGTEITYFEQDNFNTVDYEWKYILENTNFSSSRIEEILETLHNQHGILLESQTNLGSSSFKKNYYYHEQNPALDKNNLGLIRSKAMEMGVSVNINKCNPMAGDPEHSYDVDFIPLGTGKDKIVEFMLDKYGVSRDRSFAFGDSGNDIAMLTSVGHGYLVENATEEAKSQHTNISIGKYAEGILNTLNTYI